ncbi:hypothetical protein RJ640_016651 [Escallonia rubra]|uniref:Uncharacterized protein n=1 Tax=Escallonia rubra TaxID=112253 RepID=A0AA88RI75_9ASTE|nr:hypothetical protein RJ640_016651 [Escallonia rubra]
MRSVQLGLLCVQKYPEDRPSMSSVVLMLGSDGGLPSPKQPGFFTERSTFVEKSDSRTMSSNNEYTITTDPLQKAQILETQRKEQTINKALEVYKLNWKQSNRTVEEQIENQKLINEDLDTQLTMAKFRLNEVSQKLSSVEVELDDRIHCCEELEATCLELQLQLERLSSKFWMHNKKSGKKSRFSFFEYVTDKEIPKGSVDNGKLLENYTSVHRISMVAYRDELCFTTVLRAFANTSRNRTSCLQLIEINGGSDLVVGTYQGSSVDSKEDFLVTRDGFLRNLDLTSGNSSDFTGFFSNESISSSFSQSGEVEPKLVTAVNTEMTRKSFGRDDEVAAPDWMLKWDTLGVWIQMWVRAP